MKSITTKRIIIVAMIVCLIIVACALASCSIKKKALDNVDATSIKYDGQLIEWSEISHADYYAVDVNGQSYKATEPKLECQSNVDVTISVLAKAYEDNDRYFDAEEAAVAKFTAVGPVTVSFDGAEFVWTEAEGYTEYLCEQSGIDTLLRVTGTSLSPARHADENDNTTASLRVKPYVTADHSFAVWSNLKEVTILRTPTNIKYNAIPDLATLNADQGIILRNLITWDRVVGATKYKVELQGKDGGANIVKDVFTNEFVFNPEVVDWDNYTNNSSRLSFWVKVTAIGDLEKDIMDSQTKEKNFSHIEPVREDDIKEDHGTITWAEYDASKNGADKFEVFVCYLDKSNQLQMNTYTTYKPTLDVFDANILYTVQILASSDDDSKYSTVTDPRQFQFFPVPVLTMKANGSEGTATNAAVEWGTLTITQENGVNVWANYEIDVYKNADRSSKNSSALFHTQVEGTEGNTRWDWPFTDSGEYYVYCTAVDSTGSGNSSRYSDPIHVIILEQVASVSFATKDWARPTFTAEGKQKVSGKVLAAFNAPKYANGVRIFLDETTPVESQNTSDDFYYSVENDVAYKVHFTMELLDGDPVDGTYQGVNLQSTYENAGVVEDRDGVKTIIFNSELSTGFNLKQLDQVTGVDCVADVLSWSPVTDAVGYWYSILPADKNSTATPVEGFVYGTSVPVPSFLSVGAHQVYIAPQGNGNIKVTGQFSSPYYLYKLAEPKNVRVEEDSMTLTWDGDISAKAGEGFSLNAAAYSLSIGNFSTTLTTNTYTIENTDLLRLSGSMVTVRAIATRDTNLKGKAAAVSSAFSTGIVLYKLSTPQAPTITDKSFSWNKIESAGSYSIYFGNGVTAANELCRFNVPADQNVTPHVDIIADPWQQVKTDGTEVSLSDVFAASKGSLTPFFVVAHPGTRENHSKFVKIDTDGVDRYYFDSDPGLTKSITVFDAPNPETDDATGEMTWSINEQVSGYCVVVRRDAIGSETPTDTYMLKKTQNTFTPLIFGANGGKIKLELYAIGDNGLSSIRSQSKFWEISLTKHATPNANNFDVYFKDGIERNTLVVKMKDAASAEALRYGVVIGGVEKIFNVETLCGDGAEITLGAGDYSVAIRALGGDQVKVNDKYDPLNRYLESDVTFLTDVAVLRNVTQHDIRLVRVAVNEAKVLAVEVDKILHATHIRYALTYKDSTGAAIGDPVQGNVAYGADTVAHILLDKAPENAASVAVSVSAYVDPASDTIVDSLDSTLNFNFPLK